MKRQASKVNKLQRVHTINLSGMKGTLTRAPGPESGFKSGSHKSPHLHGDSDPDSDWLCLHRDKLDSNPDSDHPSHVDCDPDSNPDSGPGACVNAAISKWF